jgi:radical SAM modification target selenobiotic family peptide
MDGSDLKKFVIGLSLAGLIAGSSLLPMAPTAHGASG